MRRPLIATLALLLPPILPAQTAYYRHAVFDNSQQRDYYWNSSAVATAPSTLEQQNWRLPVETKNVLSPPNALRLHWRSERGGGWDAEIHLVNFRNRFPELSGQTLYLWLYAPQGIAAADLPDLVLSDAREGLQVATFPGRRRWAPRPCTRSIRRTCKVSSFIRGAPTTRITRSSSIRCAWTTRALRNRRPTHRTS